MTNALAGENTLDSMKQTKACSRHQQEAQMTEMTDSDYLRLLTRKLFHSGFNKALVDQRWANFEEVFFGFDPARVAAMTDDDIQRLLGDTRIIRHSRKIRATIHNARAFIETKRSHGSWGKWLSSQRNENYTHRSALLQAQLRHCGPNTIYYFLLEAGEVLLTDKPKNVR